jgi:hypothetical protein
MAQKLKRLSEAPILERFPDLITFPEVETRLWDEAYFVESSRGNDGLPASNASRSSGSIEN